VRLTDYLFGWREIRTTGTATKALTDFLLLRQIPAELLSENGTTTARIGRADAKRVLIHLSSLGFKAETGKVKGLPALLQGAVRRPGILIGVLLSVLFFFFARGRVWEVSITGDGSVDEDEVRSALYAAGLRPGMRIRDLSAGDVATNCLLCEDRFSGMNVSLSGVVARVEWYGRQGDGSVPSTEKGTGVNVVASCDGVIVSVQPTCGVAVVVPGQTVHKGDLLISGVTSGGTVRAAGTVTARVSDVFSATAGTTAVKSRIESTKAVAVSFRMFGETVFSLGSPEDSASVKEIVLPGGVSLPFSFRIGYRCNVRKETETLSESRAAEEALRRLNWLVREALCDGELLKKEITGRFTEEGYSATATVEYLINIGKPLAFTTGNEYNK